MSSQNGTAIVAPDPTAFYGYIPTKYVTILFLTLFSLSTVLHSGQAIKYRLWWIFPSIVLGGTLEIIGWVCRLISSNHPLERMPYILQTTFIVLAPTPLLAANFVIIETIIRLLGPSYSRIRPKLYTIIFCSSDVISLLVQGGGGGIAASATTSTTENLGANIVLGGLVFQTLVIVVYAFCSTEFFMRYQKRRPFRGKATGPNEINHGKLTWNIQLMLYALLLNTFCLFIRAVYRIIEFADGWEGKVIHTQVLFNVFDGAMITLAIWTTNFFHPGRLLATKEEDTEMQHINTNPGTT
ncbi:RTA1-like protein [Gymnopilus junonius]|uniref:RTA1-like protein n=1 Tax=Gymnopilus junonius TaxID=109634 RepID=A0A9P5NWT9_GYMJU|nr:RTA1-like protein [Gymnopilus junonius]